MFDLSAKTDYYLTDENYPLKKAKDASGAELYDGTPIKADMFNQVSGFFQAAIKQAWGGTEGHISGSADNANSSDVLDGIMELVRQKVAAHAALTATSAHGAKSYPAANTLVSRDANGCVQTGTPATEAAAVPLDFLRMLPNKYVFTTVRVAAYNPTTSGLQTIDGVALAAGDLVLIYDYITTAGVWRVQTGEWTSVWRGASGHQYDYIFVSEGSSHGGKIFVQKGYSGYANFKECPYSMDDEGKRVVRNKIDACQEYRPPIGIPTMWFTDLPSWALDCGNGASTKYLWSDFPNLQNSLFQSFLTTMAVRGHCTAYDSTGFYVPDLRGLVPICSGTNAVHTGETTSGGDVGEYCPSHNKAHTHDKGTFRIQGEVSEFKHVINTQINGTTVTDIGEGALHYQYDPDAATAAKVDTTSSGQPQFKFTLDTDQDNGAGFTGSTGSEGGDAVRPPSIGFRWIVRYK